MDDERLVRWAIAETLADQGFEISEAGDAASAKRAVASPGSAPDLVLLDLRLPDCDDLELAAFIRTSAPNTSIVLMTAYGTDDILTQAAGLGITIMLKPFDMRALSAIVDSALAPRAA